jgi:hypothetical protein
MAAGDRAGYRHASWQHNPCCVTVLFNLDDLSIVEFRTSAKGDEALSHGCES